ncbi:uncharacterized protein LOC141707765 [Apium graveolens]|uniref:uncharacterized protein LOC141707765 n=1 Tax=Apium graveolens TaxID=4045 RepID=UPI003D7B6B7D
MELLREKNRHNCSNNGFDDLPHLIGLVLPDDHKLPEKYYTVRKMIRGLNMEYEKIDACENDCMLFYEEHSENTKCDKYKRDRYKEIRNVRLGLSTDGFDPFRDAHAKEYTVWPVVIVVYNLSPSMCNKDPYMFMPLLIPEPTDPTKDLHVYLRPLFDELKLLWHTGVETYDIYSCTNVMMKAALLWTISDFPALSILSGWSTKGNLACPVCMGEVKAKQLKHGGKSTFYGTSRYFLEADDPLRRRTRFGSIETRSVCARNSGSFAKTMCDQIQFPPPGKSTERKPRDYGVTHNWTHSSPFFELSYWETLSLRHNIDIMHTEKNIFDNIFYIILDDGKKSKDNTKARNEWFFDLMEHLPLHLATECKLGGPANGRWMYFVERYLHNLKLKVGNKARAEGSMAQRYIEEESVHFCSLFFDSKVVNDQLHRNEAPRKFHDVELLEVYTYLTHPSLQTF